MDEINGHQMDILETIALFIDTCPALEDKSIETSRRIAEREDKSIMTVTIDGVSYLVQVTRIG